MYENLDLVAQISKFYAVRSSWKRDNIPDVAYPRNHHEQSFKPQTNKVGMVIWCKSLAILCRWAERAT